MKKLLILSILIMACPAWATTYYMRNDGTAANKGAATSCSAVGTAMSVATHNAETFAAGDIISYCSEGGTITSTITPPTSGVTYNDFIIDTSIAVTGWTDEGGGIYSKANTYTIMLFEDGAALIKGSDVACTGGNWFHNGGVGDTLYYKPTSGTPTDHTVKRQTDSVDNVGMKIWKDSITINRANISYCLFGILLGSNSSGGDNFTGITIQNSSFSYNGQAIVSNVFLSKTGSNVSVLNNLINYCGSGIQFLNWSGEAAGTSKHTGLVITGNTLTNMGYVSSGVKYTQAISGSPDQEAIAFQDTTNSTVANNVINGTDAFGIYFYNTAAGTTKLSNNSVYKNRISNIIRHGIYFGNNSGGGVENNIIAYNILNAVGGGSTNNGIYAQMDANAASGTNYIANNTLVGIVGFGIRLNPECGTWVVKNNIVEADTVNVREIHTTSTYTFTNNIYTSDGAAKFYSGGNLNFAGWQAAGFDATGSSVADPLLTSTYGLQPSSPAKDTGDPWATYAQMMTFGVIVNGSAPDIGGSELVKVLDGPKPPIGGKGHLILASAKAALSTSSAAYVQGSSSDDLLLEDGFFLLLETGDYLLLE